MKVITTVQCNRPDYTKRMLDSLSECDGIENYLLLAYLEPGNDEVVSLFEKFDICNKIVSINPTKFGCNKNTGQALSYGTILSDSILHVEDDVILSKEALSIYEEWASRKSHMFSLSLYNKVAKKDYNPFMYHAIGHRDTFIPWGFGIKKRYVELALAYDCFTMEEPYLSWDCRIDKMCKERGLEHFYTYLSRANNIGAVGGVHVPSAEWHRENQHLSFWAGDLE